MRSYWTEEWGLSRLPEVEELRQAMLSAALGEFLGSSVVADARIGWCDPDEIPEPYRGLLVHDGDMTSTLERFHRDVLTLEIMRVGQAEGNYLREVVLRKKGTGEAVEYGAIEVLLGAFSASMRVAILDGGQPLGGLLNSTGLVYGSEPIGFFGLTGSGIGDVFSETPGGGVLFGRYNRLVDENGVCLARIIEVLPCVSG